MAQAIHKGRGRWAVIDDAGATIFGPASEAEARAWLTMLTAAGERPPTPAAAKPEMTPADKERADFQRQREHSMATDAALRARLNDVSGKVMAVLVDAFGHDRAARMMQDIRPVLADPSRESKRRERQMAIYRKTMKPGGAKPAAA